MRMLSSISPERSWPLRSLSRNQMDYMFGDFEKIIDGLMRTTYEGSSSFQPRCDVSETQDHYLASFDMPGVKKEDIKIEVQGTQIIISGERRLDVKDDVNEVNIRTERTHGKFERTFNLPTSVNTEKIEAQYEDGVLSIAIPKAEVTKARTIPIQSGQDSKRLSSKVEPAKHIET